MSAPNVVALPAAAQKAERVSVFGLGKVGLVLAQCLAQGGCRVVGVDSDARVVESANRAASQLAELGVSPHSISETLRATSHAADAVENSDLTFVVVPTPSNAAGAFSLRYVLRACNEIGAALRRKSAYHVVAMVSTMLPGSSQHIVMPYLNKVSGRRTGRELGYCYNPAFIALGEVAQGFQQPDFVLIGESDSRAGDCVLTAHRRMSRNSAPAARMNPTEAEIAKIASNTHETMRVSFANMLFSVCNEVPGADVDRITNALAHRMGKRFFKGATPYGGPCWPRDNAAFAVFMNALGVPSMLPATVDAFNREHGKYILRKILDATPAGAPVGLLGMAYKPGTPVLDKSFGIDLARWLKEEGRPVVIWDPLSAAEVKAALGETVSVANSGDHCLNQARTIVIVNAIPELENLDWSLARNRTVLDCWRCLPPEKIAMLEDYRPLGRGASRDGETLLSKIAASELCRMTE